MRTITLNEFRKIKDPLPSGSMYRITDEPGLHVDIIRSFFEGYNSKEGRSAGIHLEPGPNGGLVMLDDTTVPDRALKILDEINMSMQEEQVTEPMQTQDIKQGSQLSKQLELLTCLPPKADYYGR